jgi:hypothetical protein
MLAVLVWGGDAFCGNITIENDGNEEILSVVFKNGVMINTFAVFLKPGKSTSIPWTGGCQIDVQYMVNGVMKDAGVQELCRNDIVVLK